MRLSKKEDRLSIQNGMFTRMIEKGFERSEYKDLIFFTGEIDGKHQLKVFKGTSTNPILFCYYRDQAGRTAKIESLKKSADYRQEEKAKAKENPTHSTAANCAAAIRTELKEQFPGIKFSVKSDNFAGGNSVDINWQDGPTTDEVKEISDKYQYGHFDGMNDIYEYSNNIANLPQAKYVSETRTASEAINALRSELENLLGDYCKDGDFYSKPENILYRIFHKQSFPAGAEITGIEPTEITGGSIEDFYRITYTTPEAETKTAEAANIAPAPAGTIQIVDYSEKAIAVIGNFTDLYNKLIEIGGKYNSHLKCGKGIIFSKKKLAEVQALLA